MHKVNLFKGNNIELLKNMEDNSVDSVVTDAPYGLSFMGKKWDYDVPSVDFWKEVYRVLKPGGHILSFGGTRTYHRMVVNIEDAGFEIRDQIMWIYGSGFPKSHNISKAIDKLEGNERKVIGRKIQRVDGTTRNTQTNGGFMKDNVRTKPSDGYIDIEEPGSENSKKFEGWGTALKPANEPICLARKPLSEKSVAENVLKWGTGGINVDGCRIGIEGEDDRSSGIRTANFGSMDYQSGGNGTEPYIPNEGGRFPANIIFDEDAADILDKQSGISKTNCKSGVVEGKEAGQMYHRHEQPSNNYKKKIIVGDYNDKGGASRFFYVAKVSKKERNMGLEEFEEKKKWLKGGGGSGISDRENIVAKNNHPTVKPINLMTYLCRLITPEGGICLDPFMGSGSTGIAARLEGFRFIGMEMDEDYFNIAQARIEDFESYRSLLKM